MSGPRINLELDPELHKRLKELAAREERSLAAQVRHILRQWVEGEESHGGYRSDMSPKE